MMRSLCFGLALVGCLLWVTSTVRAEDSVFAAPGSPSDLGTANLDASEPVALGVSSRIQSAGPLGDSPAVPGDAASQLIAIPPLLDGQVPAAKPTSSADRPATAPADSAATPASALVPVPDPAFGQDPSNGPSAIHDDYLEAMREATEDRKLMFIYFYDPMGNAAARAFEQSTLADREIQEKLGRYVVARLPLDGKITVEDKEIELLKHPAFAEMLGRQGVAIIDLAHPKAEYYGYVVSTFPFSPGKYYRQQALSTILDLPPGTLTQRTMIYAVRIHPEAPASTQGQFHTVLAEEAKSHSVYQASILVQGHHSWDSRFQRISARLGGSSPQEVVAESWPNESLVEACVDCVHSWRQSPGHWGAVRSRHSVFGYDIKRGRNGIWYATGIFGRR